jgi:hypothetical protein
MKSFDLAIAHDIPVDEFNAFLQRIATFPIKKNFLGDIFIPDDVDSEALVQLFLQDSKMTAEEAFNAQEKRRYEQEEIEKKKKEEQYHLRIENLKARNLEGYYEYKVISLLDIGGLFKSNSGRVDVEAMTQTLNELGIDGWHLATAYSNELGKNALSGGAGGILLGANSTVDENVLIFERFVKI